jgi:hypothetical protein
MPSTYLRRVTGLLFAIHQTNFHSRYLSELTALNPSCDIPSPLSRTQHSQPSQSTPISTFVACASSAFWRSSEMTCGNDVRI